MTLPVTIIGGYLGSGKTTLVNHLLRNANGKRLAVLVNEFGELPIDEDLIEAQDDTMISIAGGCVCCSYGNDLMLAMMDLGKLEPRPDHVLIEASGIALPGAIAGSISLLKDIEVDGTIVLVDAETIRGQAADAYVADTIARQIDDADLIVLNKVDLLSAYQLAGTTRWLAEQNARPEVIPCSRGVVRPEVLLQSFIEASADATGDAQVPDVHETANFSSVSFEIHGRLDIEQLAEFLASAELGLVRAKGFAHDGAGELKTLQVVSRRWTVTPAPVTAKPGLVAIGQCGTFDRAAIERSLANCAVAFEST